MTWEEMERTMDFIVRQQAQFTINHQNLDASMHRLETNLQRLETNLQRLETDLQREHDERIHDKARIARVEACMVMLTELAEIQSRRIDRNEHTS